MKRKESTKTKQILLGGIIAFIMVTSVIGFLGGRENEESLKYNGFSLVRNGNLWETRINKQQISFYYFPSEVESIQLESEVKNRITSTPMIYLTYNSSQKDVQFIAQAQYDLGNFLSENYNIYSARALTEKSEYLPQITCLNATAAIPVIDFKEANDTRIYLKESCIIVEAKSGYDFLKARDRLIYGFLGVING